MSQFSSEKQQILDTALRLVQKGLLMATGGNLSIRVPGTDVIAITPSNYDYLEMTPDDICILDRDGRQLEGSHKPSVESAMHLAIYHVRADVNAIVHTHQVYASTLSLIKSSIPALFDEQVRFLGKSIDVIPYAPSGTSFLKNTIARHIHDQHNAYIMQNHGLLCFGTNLLRAAENVEIVEKCAITYLIALCTDRKITKIPLLVQEIAFQKLRKDQTKAAHQLHPVSTE